MGSGSDKHTYTALTKRNVFHEWDGKLFLAQDKAPSKGEPGQPRGLNTDQRTPGPKLGSTNNYTNNKDTRRRTNFAQEA